MRRTSAFQFGLPRFHGAVRNVVLLSLGIWIILVLLSAFDSPDAALLMKIGSLNPYLVVRHWWLWQLVTYAFVHLSPGHIFATMLGVYFIGSSVQEISGKRPFLELYLTSSIVAGLAGVLLSMTGYVGEGITTGAGPAANAVLMVFYLFYREASIYLFPFPFQIPVKYVVLIFAALEAAGWLLSHFSLFYMVNLLGLGAGYLWHRFLYRRASMSTLIEDRAYGIRNSYHRWKRRRAAKKFQVYMRKHQHDPKQYFDEYGNFKPPDDNDKKDRGGWVN